MQSELLLCEGEEGGQKCQRRGERGTRKPRKRIFQKRGLGHLRDAEREEWSCKTPAEVSNSKLIAKLMD